MSETGAIAVLPAAAVQHVETQDRNMRGKYMAIGKTKVAVIGCGLVGSTLSYYLASNRICNKLLLIDLNEKKAWAEATDLRHSLGYSNSKVQIESGSYGDCGDADVVILAVAAPYRDGMTRLDMYEKACSIMDSIIPPVMESGFEGIFLVITNPVDLITQYVQKLSGLPDRKVIGTGTSLDSARLRMYLADLMDVDPRSVDALCMGEHGDSQMIPWSQVTVGGKSFHHILKDDPNRLGGLSLDDVLKEITGIAYEVVRSKGATCYGIASVSGQIVRAILFDENKVIPVSCMLHGEYGFEGIYAGIPAVLNSQGVKELVTYHLTEEETARLNRSLGILEGCRRKGSEKE